MIEGLDLDDAVAVTYYARDGSVFLDTHYLIKGVAGALFWKLAREHERNRRREFSLRELRLWGHELRLPEVQDNLSARMLLLQRRLAERDAPLQVVRIGRGRFRVDLRRRLHLTEVPHPGRAVPPQGSPAYACTKASVAEPLPRLPPASGTGRAGELPAVFQDGSLGRHRQEQATATSA